MEELKSSSSFSQKERTILIVIGMILLIVFLLSVFLIYQKFKPTEQDRKISIVNLAEEINKSQKEQVVEENKIELSENQIQAQDKKNSPAEISVKVLNGGAAIGTAGKIKDKLFAKGYTKIEAGNAKLSNYQGVMVYYKKDFKDQVDDIKQILSEQYKMIATKEGANSNEIDGDIVVVMGKQ